jgi:hypothetical protein
MNISSFKASPVVSSLAPPCYQYTTSKNEGGKYPRQVSKGNLLVEVLIALL